MRTYDPADRILYVHVAPRPAALAAPPPAQEECHRLPDGYANASVRAVPDEGRPSDARPALVLLPGGAAAADVATPAARALRLAAR